MSCSTNEFYCGDSVVQTGLEACEPSLQSGCNVNCEWIAPTCNLLTLTPNPTTSGQQVYYNCFASSSTGYLIQVYNSSNTLLHTI